MRRIIPVLLGVAVPITAIAPALLLAVDDYVIGESEANISYDAGFLGYWRYDLTVTWDVTAYPDGGHDLSHMSFVIGLEDCPIACRNGYFVFPDTAGSSLGGGGCTVYYYVEFNCTGDPTTDSASLIASVQPRYSSTPWRRRGRLRAKHHPCGSNSDVT
jgi:hypothetical protein